MKSENLHVLNVLRQISWVLLSLFPLERVERFRRECHRLLGSVFNPYKLQLWQDDSPCVMEINRKAAVFIYCIQNALPLPCPFLTAFFFFLFFFLHHMLRRNVQWHFPVQENPSATIATQTCFPLSHSCLQSLECFSLSLSLDLQYVALEILSCSHIGLSIYISWSWDSPHVSTL